MENKDFLSEIGGYTFQVDDFSFKTLLTVLETGLELQKDIEEFLIPYGISHGRFSILLTLYKYMGNPVYPSQIADELKRKRPTITGMVKKLLKEGYVREISDTGDGRRKQVTLAEKGFRLLEKIIPVYNKRIEYFAGDLEEGEKHELIRLVSKIRI